MKSEEDVRAALHDLSVMSELFALDDPRQDGQVEGVMVTLRWVLGEKSALDLELEFVRWRLSTLTPES